VFLCLRREKMVVFEEGEDGCEWMGPVMFKMFFLIINNQQHIPII